MDRKGASALRHQVSVNKDENVEASPSKSKKGRFDQRDVTDLSSPDSERELKVSDDSDYQSGSGSSSPRSVSSPVSSPDSSPVRSPLSSPSDSSLSDSDLSDSAYNSGSGSGSSSGSGSHTSSSTTTPSDESLSPTEPFKKVLLQRTMSMNEEDLPIPLEQMSIGKQLGRGAFGSVCRLESLDESCPNPGLAIKLPENEKRVDSLKHEAELLAEMPLSENVLTLYGVHKIGSSEGLIMELVEGKSLDDIFKQLRTLYQKGEINYSDYWGASRYLIREAIQGLVHLEKYGIVHADVKPDNFMLDKNDLRVKVIDFGCSGEAGKDVMPGHELYMSPQALESFRNPGGTVTATKLMNSYSIGQMTYSIGESTQDGLEYFTAGAIIGDLGRNERALLGYRLYSPMKAYEKYDREGGWKAIVPVSEESRLNQEHYDKVNRILIDHYGIDSLVSVCDLTWRYVANLPGYYNAAVETDYVRFVNALLHPDPELRMSLEDALEHKFLARPHSEEDVEVLRKLFV
ncbi:protein kinase domain-containing protein [Endozoicomonas arenosclerae]|uniref:protein kinase domain-containing protein n=1 Tax=Endozoicomonas arenosclerae TaxID=1633495 RepID=UPI000783EA7D|nr:protein kinase [Endozoicomonas arenosclerae]